MDDFDSLLGDQPPRKKRGRPTKEEAERRRLEAQESEGLKRLARAARTGQSSPITPEELRQLPVAKNFFARFFPMDPMVVTKRLADCKPFAMEGGGRPVYLFGEALPYLVKPKMTAEQFARTLNKADLPPEINKAFWDSQRSRVKYKIESQEAWETEDVMRVLGEVAMLFKDSTTMVVEEMRNRAKLTDEQTEILQECIDELRKEIRKKLVEMPQKEQTQPLFGKPLFGISGDVEREPDVPETGWYGDDEDDEE